MIIIIHKTRFQDIRLEHPGGFFSRTNSTPAAPQPAKVADRATWLQKVAAGLTSPTTPRRRPTRRAVLGMPLVADPHPPQPEPTRLEARHPALHVSNNKPTGQVARHPASGVPDSGASIPCGAYCS